MKGIPRRKVDISPLNIIEDLLYNNVHPRTTMVQSMDMGRAILNRRGNCRRFEVCENTARAAQRMDIVTEDGGDLDQAIKVLDNNQSKRLGRVLYCKSYLMLLAAELG